MSTSFYVYEEQYKPKCIRCENADAATDYEFCHECINEMITPGYSHVASELLAEHIREEVAE